MGWNSFALLEIRGIAPRAVRGKSPELQKKRLFLLQNSCLNRAMSAAARRMTAEEEALVKVRSS